MPESCLAAVRRVHPLIHNITNYVTVNDVANILLACGASPIMSDEPREAREIAGACDGLCINIGTLNERTIKAMELAGQQAGERGRVILLDPVGAGASALRTETSKTLMKLLPLTAIRGNMSEIRALFRGSVTTRGVDVALEDAVTEDNLSSSVEAVRAYAGEAGVILAVTGAIDLVSDGKQCFVIHNGREEMERITGTGCQLSAMMTAYLAASPDRPLEAAAAAVCTMGLAGELARGQLRPCDGNMAYRSRIIDAVYNMDEAVWREGSRYEIR